MSAHKDEDVPRKSALSWWLWIAIAVGAAIMLGVWWLAR